ncbi:MAG: hypothetical protein IKJ58_02135 [Akkermansia sp.]|nr:hypothetical protein [Akkermansia sp.]
MGFISPIIGGISEARQYSTQKKMALANGQAQKNAAYAQATASEQASKAQLQVTAENLARMAGNRRREKGAARNANAATGFTSEGSGSTAEAITDKVHAQAMADLARSGSTESLNAFDQQVAARRQGDMAMRAAEIEAQQYAAMAKASRTGAFISALGAVAGGVYGGIDGYLRADEFNKDNADAIKAGTVKKASLFDFSVRGAMQGGDAGGGLLAATNPFTAAYAGQSWQRNLNGYLNVGKIK